MMFRSVFAFRTWSCVVASLFLAGVLSALSTGNALAGSITYDNTTFTGTSTDLTTVGNQTLPYTDASSRVVSKVSGTVPGIFSTLGVVMPASSVISFTNLASGTTDFGFDAKSASPSSSHITSVSFDNGDSYTTSLNLASGNTFYHFSDTASFTAATVTFTGGTNYLGDFRTAAATSSVPEPSSLALLAAGAMFAGVSAWRRRKAS